MAVAAGAQGRCISLSTPGPGSVCPLGGGAFGLPHYGVAICAVVEGYRPDGHGANRPVGGLRGPEVEIAGIIVAVRNFAAVNGKPMKFVSIADETEIAEVILFPGAYRRMAYVVSRSRAIRIRARVKMG